jgi:hypothetical protein
VNAAVPNGQNSWDQRCHGKQQRGEVRAAPRREARRTGDPVPRLAQPALLDRRDRPVLGAVERERTASQQPTEQRGRRQETRDEADGVRREHERERRRDGEGEKEPLATRRDAGPAKERRE